MHRFFIRSSSILKDKIIISDPQTVHHIRDVLRLKKKEEVVLCDEKGWEYTCVIEELAGQIKFRLKEKHMAVKREDKPLLCVACAIPKKAKMGDIIDKLTQLGVDRIISLKTERVVVKIDKNKEVLLRRRWEKISLSAAEQSQRNSPMLIEALTDFKKALSACAGYDLKLIPTLSGDRRPLKEVLDKTRPTSILFFIGPEGDFTEKEIELARQAGCIPVSLGDLVLRVDTAAVAVAGYIRLYFQV